MKLYIDSIALLGEGLPNWSEARETLAARNEWTAQDVTIPPPAGLPAAERRRVSQSIKLAMAVAHQTIDNQADAPTRHDPSSLATVFSSSAGDGQNCHILCDALTDADPQISPTRFTNSVHNAPSGYWSIATGCHEYSTSLAGYEGSFAAGLTEAALLAVTENRPVLLVVYDAPYPFPLNVARAMKTPFGAGLILNPQSGPESIAALSFLADDGVAKPVETRMAHPELESMRTTIPAARCLPVCQAIARREAAQVYLPMPSGRQLGISVAFDS